MITYYELGGIGEPTKKNMILLLLYHVGAGSVGHISSICRNTVFCRRILAELTRDGYVSCQKKVLSGITDRTPGRNLYCITKHGIRYVRKHLLDTERLPNIFVRQDRAELLDVRHRQFFHSVGELDFLYFALANFYPEDAVYIEYPIPGLPFRPDVVYNYRNRYLYLVEEDTGSQRAAVIRIKCDRYASFCEYQIKTRHMEDICRYILVFHLNELRNLSGSVSRKNISGLIDRARDELLAEYGAGFAVPVQHAFLKRIPVSALSDKAVITDEELKRMKERLPEETARNLLERDAVSKYIHRRMRAFSGVQGLERAWMLGFRTLLISGHYTEEYLKVCCPFLHTELKQYLGGIGYTPDSVYGVSSLSVTVSGRQQVLISPQTLTNGNRVLFVENITHDLSGRYRAEWLVKHGSDCELLLIAENPEEVTDFLNQHAVAGGCQRIYSITYQSILNEDYRLVGSDMVDYFFDTAL